MNKYYNEVSSACELRRADLYLVEEGAGKVAKVLEAAGQQLGAPVELKAFARFAVGESA